MSRPELQRPLTDGAAKNTYGLSEANALVHSGTSVIRAKLDTDDKKDCASLGCTAFGIWQPWMAFVACLFVDGAVAARSLCKKTDDASAQAQTGMMLDAATTTAEEKAKGCIDRTFFLLAISDVYNSVRTDQPVNRHSAVRGGAIGGVFGTVANCIWGVKPVDADASVAGTFSPAGKQATMS